MKKRSLDLDFLKNYFSRDAFAALCGIELVDAEDGFAQARMRIQNHHLNGLNRVHGGALFTLADLAFAAAVHTRRRVAVSINNTISYIKAPSGDILYAKAREVSKNNRLATYAVEVSDSSGEIIAAFQGLAYLKNERIDNAPRQDKG